MKKQHPAPRVALVLATAPVLCVGTPAQFRPSAPKNAARSATSFGVGSAPVGIAFDGANIWVVRTTSAIP